MKKTMSVPRNRQTIAAKRVHIPVWNDALLPESSSLMWFLMMPNKTKSVAMTTIVTIQATVAVTAPKIAPQNPEPAAKRKAMKARAHATGWRTITRVRAFEVLICAPLKSVLSTPSINSAGL